MPRFSHLEIKSYSKHDWTDSLLRRNISKMFLQVQEVNDFIAMIERMLVIAVNRIEHIRTYLRP